MTHCAIIVTSRHRRPQFTMGELGEAGKRTEDAVGDYESRRGWRSPQAACKVRPPLESYNPYRGIRTVSQPLRTPPKRRSKSTGAPVGPK